MVVDMLELDVDVIVNLVNKDMKYIGGIVKFIVEKGAKNYMYLYYSIFVFLLLFLYCKKIKYV